MRRIRLPESERTRERRPGAALASVALHGGLIALALSATVGRDPHAAPAPDVPVLVYRAPPTPPSVATAPDDARRDGAGAGPAAPSPAPSVPIPSPGPVPDVVLPGPLAPDLVLPDGGVGRDAFGVPGDRMAAPGVPGSGSGDAVLALREVERAALPLGDIRPRYPDALRARGADGDVLARYVVDAAGRVAAGSVEIVAATDSLFAGAVRAALRDARFRPAEVGGLPVAQLVEQRFLFTLRDR